MSYIVITHAGRAHIDEILAAAVLAVHRREYPLEIRRLDSKVVEKMVLNGMVSENSWVIDCGLVHHPERRLFDHHQNGASPSSALMMLNHLFPELEGTDLHRYFELVSRVDTQGARSLGDYSRESDSRDYWGFSQEILTELFEKDPLAVLDIYARGLKNKIELEEVKKAAEEWAAFPGNISTEEVMNLRVLNCRERPPIELFNGLQEIYRGIIEQNSVAAVYGYDRNDPSVRILYRTDFGHDVLDFSRAAPGSLLFSHKSGFLVKFIPTDADEWKRILSASLTRKREGRSQGGPVMDA